MGGSNFMSELHLRQLRFTFSACESFRKNKKRIQKYKEKRDCRYIYWNGLDMVCFQHDLAYEDFKDLAIATAFDKILHNKWFNIAINPQYDQY